MQTATFDTDLGVFGIGWTDQGLARLQLPGLEPETLRARLNRDGAAAGEPPRSIADLMNRIEDYATGEAVSFASVVLDFGEISVLNSRIYDALMQVGWGVTTTYGALARQMGDVNLSRAVGAAMGTNPIPLIIPCHRVLASDGKLGGFSAPGGTLSKLRMLELEGVRLGAQSGQMSFGF